MRYKSAFTLVELIIVVGITGMIAYFAVPSFTNAIKRAYEKQAVNSLEIIYAKQKLRIATGAPTVDYLNLADMNAGLGLSINSDKFTYRCWGAPSQGAGNFLCCAYYMGQNLSLCVVNRPLNKITPLPNPWCWVNAPWYVACPTVPTGP